MGETAVKPSIEQDNAGQRLSRQKYRELVDSLPADRQEAHLRALLIWVREGAVRQAGDSFPL